MELGLQGRRALVLGATGGLGSAVARSLAQEGVSLIIAARDSERLASLRQRLGTLTTSVTAVPFDLCDPASIDRLLDQAGDAVDVLVNNTGGPPPGPVLAVTEQQWAEQFSAMFASVTRISRRLVGPMQARGWGRVVSIVSSGVVQPIDNLGVSNALRLAIVGWSKTLANEVAADGVTVNCVAPGRIATSRVAALDVAAAERTGQSVEAVAAASIRSIPVGRYGLPEEFGDVVTFLASSRASFVNGSVVRVDGGMIRSV